MVDGEDGFSKAAFFEFNRAAHAIPDLDPPLRCVELIQYFQSIRSMSGNMENPITMSDIVNWQEHKGFSLDRWEREAVFLMDGALRQAYADVVKYHAGRTKIKQDSGKDRRLANG